MCSSRINRAASTTDADVPTERGFLVIVSRTLFAIVPPPLSYAILALLLSVREREWRWAPPPRKRVLVLRRSMAWGHVAGPVYIVEFEYAGTRSLTREVNCA